MLSLTRLMMIMVVMRMVGVIIMEAMRMVILMTIAPPHQTRDDHGDEDEGCLGLDTNECFALKFVMILKKIMITKKEKKCNFVTFAGSRSSSRSIFHEV